MKSQIARHGRRLLGYVGLACRERFRGSYLGLLWTALHPVLPLVVNSLVIGHLLGKNSVEYMEFVAAGFIPWFYLAQAVQMTNRSLVHHMSMLRTEPTAVPVLFCAEVLVSMIPMFAWIPILWLLGEMPNPAMLLVAVFSLTAGAVAVSFLLSVAQIFFRDLRFLLPLFLQSALFLSPILYTYSQWPFHGVIPHASLINPLYVWIEPVQSILNGESPKGLQTSLVASAFAVWLASFVWNQRRQEIVLHG